MSVQPNPARKADYSPPPVNAVGDRAAEGTLAFGPFHIDVNPLMIARAGRKRVDARLVDSNPVRHADLFADACPETCKSEFFHAPLLMNPQTPLVDPIAKLRRISPAAPSC